MIHPDEHHALLATLPLPQTARIDHADEYDQVTVELLRTAQLPNHLRGKLGPKALEKITMSDVLERLYSRTTRNQSMPKSVYRVSKRANHTHSRDNDSTHRFFPLS